MKMFSEIHKVLQFYDIKAEREVSRIRGQEGVCLDPGSILFLISKLRCLSELQIAPLLNRILFIKHLAHC